MKLPVDDLFSLLSDAYDHGLIGINQDTGEVSILVDIFEQSATLTFSLPTMPHLQHCTCNTVFPADATHNDICPYCHMQGKFRRLKTSKKKITRRKRPTKNNERPTP